MKKEKFDEASITKYAMKKYGNRHIVWWFIEGARYQFKKERRKFRTGAGAK